jgi:predicted DNA-binding WGR domain protein
VASPGSLPTSGSGSIPPGQRRRPSGRSRSRRRWARRQPLGDSNWSRGGSAKFWEVSREGREVTVRHGRIGSEGRVKAQPLADEAEARRHVERLIREKSGKGYVEA